ncbi:MAG: polyprenyl synthetase family protein [Armatimonadota bacterium]|nr:polyprenyl synthetase family protein [Armatimonadota bacterium]
MNLKDYLKTRQELINNALSRLLPPESELPESLHTAMRYSALDGGKRIRPILTLAAAETGGGKVEDALPAACAVELVHAFSLVHDDLPCMDNDDFRRGKPTSHKVFGEATALLAGDALLILAFEAIAQTPSSVPRKAVLDAVQLLASAAGSAGMTGGQALDVEAEGKQVTPAEVEQIHRRKTGALLEAAVVVGAIVGAADEAAGDALSEYGRGIGLAFQIVDDLLDLTGDQERLGKTVGSDLKRDKATYPSVMGVAESKRLAAEAANHAVEALASFGEAAEPLRLIARLILERDY